MELIPPTAWTISAKNDHGSLPPKIISGSNYPGGKGLMNVFKGRDVDEVRIGKYTLVS